MADNVEMAENVETAKNVESEIFGDAFGPDSEYVKLVAGDGHEFYMERRYATKAGTIASMLKFPGQDYDDGSTTVDCSVVPSHILNRICMYLLYKNHYTDYPGIPDFDLPTDAVLELLMGSHYFDC